jgi:hypothetical protein
MTGRSSMARTGIRAVAAGLVLAAFGAAAPACLSRPIEPVEPRTTSTTVERLAQSGVDKIDILLAIDNSGSMADKQTTLKTAVPKLVGALVNPRCLDAHGGFTPDTSPKGCGVTQPCGPLDICPVNGTTREFPPILDMHVGVVTSSLGGHGSNSCGDAHGNDKGHLTSRGSTDGSVPDAKTWAGKGFLVWDPNTTEPTHNPPGETSFAAFTDGVRTIVGGAGESGCFFENQLESWYRFAVDPDPYDHVELVPVPKAPPRAMLVGTDTALLQQRADFLRPDSLFAIIMLSDENDASPREGATYYLSQQGGGYHLPKPRAACATDPTSPCCRSCGQEPGAGCDTSMDDCYDVNGNVKPLSGAEDPIGLRAWDQKRRFGIDFLQPIQRYADGLTKRMVVDRYGNMVQNPLFTDQRPGAARGSVRDPSLVFLAGIVGVPWQDIARKSAGADGKYGTADDVPDLVNGIDSLDPAQIAGKKPPSGGFQSGAELAANRTWDVIVGDPNCDYLRPDCGPKDPHMIESVRPRKGANPITGDAIAPPAPGLGPNEINGHEHAGYDLQFACVYELPVPVDCTKAGNCDCKDPTNAALLPLCDPTTHTKQVRAKAYPGGRELQALKAVGEQGIVASICPAQLANDKARDYGYDPAMGAIVERLKKALGDQCLPRTLRPDSEGKVPCFILEARTVASDAACHAACGTPARTRLAESEPAVKAAKEDPLAAKLGWNCFCKLEQALGAPGKDGAPMDLTACQTQRGDTILNELGKPVNGWCYVDATTVPAIGNPELVASCPASEKRLIHFVGSAVTDGKKATTFITCEGE